MSRQFLSDRNKTQVRKQRLEQYFQQYVLKPLPLDNIRQARDAEMKRIRAIKNETSRNIELERLIGPQSRADAIYGHSFICHYASNCKRSHPEHFFAGQLHHVGSHYDLIVDGRPLRVLLCSQEVGRPFPHISMSERFQGIARSARETFAGRNAHMRGVTTILRLLFGRDPGVDQDAEHFRVNGQWTHIFNMVALPNFLLCSATDGSTKGQSTGEMQRNCATHFQATYVALQPHVIVCVGLNVARWIAQAVPVVWLSDTRGRIELARPDFPPADVLRFVHPSARHAIRGGVKAAYWGNVVNPPYVRGVVEPAIDRWREEFFASKASP